MDFFPYAAEDGPHIHIGLTAAHGGVFLWSDFRLFKLHAMQKYDARDSESTSSKLELLLRHVLMSKTDMQRLADSTHMGAVSQGPQECQQRSQLLIGQRDGHAC